MIPFITGLIASAIAQVTYCYLKDKKLKSLPKDKQKDWVEDENRNCFI